MIIVIILVLIAVVQLGLSLGILLQSNRTNERSQQIFAGLSLSILLWTITNSVLTFVDSQFTLENLWFFNITNRIAFMLGAISLQLIYIFNLFYPKHKVIRRVHKLIIFFGVLLVIVSSTELIAGNFSLVKDKLVYHAGSLSVLFVLYTFAILFLVLIENGRQLKDTNNQLLRRQTVTLLSGLVLSIFHATLFIIILPAIYGKNNILYIIGYCAPYYYTSFTVYGMVRQKLFDIRHFIVRAVGYLFSATTVGLGYVLVVYIVGGFIFDISNITYLQRLFFAIIAMIIATTYAPIIRFFNRVTNKFFYKDAYETQGVLDKVSGVIVGTVDPHKVQKGALLALSEALRPTYMGFLLVGGNEGLHGGDQIGQHWVVKDSSILQSNLQKRGKNIIVYDELEERGGGLREVLRAEDISVVAPLVTKDENIGYLVLGPKKSGNIYNSQDIGLLNIASNELAVALQNAQRFEEIQAFNITLQEKVNEATRELKKTNRKLIALDEAKDEFISMASHQLRTPLTSIKGYLSMLAEGDLGKVTKAQEKAIKEAFGSSQRMVYLIADFLNVSRIKTGKFVIEPKEVDLPMVVSEEITQLREMAGSRDITLQYQAPEVFPKVMLDDNKIRQVMMNLVDNAIYYTAAGGTVTIQLFVDSADVVFKVIDTGIGVPKREQHKLFTKFFRAGNARKARPDGTGLGLFMAQKIIAEQGGSIIFESTEGKGSTFGFRFPLSKIKT
ncbi:hypothetical protein H6801_01290 [Candidatus Nomurabacteria bacterium]|nr:hypothetical protein [Candidatus Nomurabacteria bacterium]